MNTQGCPSGKFTDEILVYDPFREFCGGDVATWLGLAVSFTVLRALLLIPTVRGWKRRQKTKQQQRTYRSSTAEGCVRLPLFLLTQVFTVVTQFLFVLLTSLNVASTRNGLSGFLCGLYFVMIGAGHVLMARSVIVLGRKIVPLSMKRVKSGEESFDSLDKFDVILKIMGLLTLISILLVPIFFLDGFAAGGNLAWTFQAAFITVATYQFTIAVGIVHQFQRCIDAVYKLQFHSSSQKDEEPSSPKVGATGKSGSGGFAVVIRTMRIQQLTTLSVGLVMCALSILLATFVIVLRYWVFSIMYFLVDIILQAALLFASVLAGKKRANTAKQNVSAMATNRVDDTRTIANSSVVNTLVAGSTHGG